jgi:hypothetical protein
MSPSTRPAERRSAKTKTKAPRATESLRARADVRRGARWPCEHAQAADRNRAGLALPRSASRRDGATGFVGQRPSRSSSPDSRLGRGPSVCRRAIGGRAAPASVRSSWDRLTAPIHGGCCVKLEAANLGLALAVVRSATAGGWSRSRTLLGGGGPGIPFQAAAAAIWWLWSLRRLWVAVISRHSERAADLPRRWKRSIRRLNFVCPNTGSIIALRFR